MDDKPAETAHPTPEREHFKKEGYNSDLRGQPIDIEPTPQDRMGARQDVRNMLDHGVVEVHEDEDDVVLDQDEGLTPPPDRP